MARVKLTELKAKSIIFAEEYLGFSSVLQIPADATAKKWVVKVDQGVKKRGKQGLIKVGISKEEIPAAIDELSAKGYSNFLIEPLLEHEQSEEQYISFEQVREGIRVIYSKQGGVEVEENDSVVEFLIEHGTYANPTPLPDEFIREIRNLFREQHFAFLEFNPFLIREEKVIALDAALLVDNAGEYFASQWSEKDTITDLGKTEEEKNIIALNNSSPASFKLDVLNPNGSMFFLFSGGGASITLADEAFTQGFTEEIGNYGEYSGGPSSQETEYYAQQVIQLLLKSDTQKKKCLIIAGGVANFTDVAKTFNGIISALKKYEMELRGQEVQVFVRRGGPNEKAGLEAIEGYLKDSGLLGKVSGSEDMLTEPINLALERINRKD